MDRLLIVSAESLLEAPELPLGLLEEDPAYLTDQLITYIGNKRSLLPAIGEATEKVCAEIGRDRIRVFDGFAGSGVVSRLFKRFASEIVSNDIESYARIIGECFLTNRDEVDLIELSG